MTMTSKMFSYEMLYHFLLNKKKRFVQYGDACCAHPSEECSAEQVLVSLCQNLYCTLFIKGILVSACKQMLS